jgi:hypothetical protein
MRASSSKIGTVPRYVIYTPTYENTSGGAMVMHRLCHTLNQLGEKAVVCGMPSFVWGGRLQRFRDRFFPKPFATNPDFQTPVIKWWQVRATDIVMYPELVADNPLRAQNVVRWLLNKPSYWKSNKILSKAGTIIAGPTDLFFKYDDRCEEPELTGGKAESLFLFSLNRLYCQTNFGARNGTCYMVRKGSNKPLTHDLEDSLKIDDLSHEEIKKIFNEREIFYAYDELSSYSQFAAICGCISVVVPGLFKDQAEFMASYPLSRFGVAYGEENIPHAIATRHLVSDYLKACECEGVQTVRNFVESTRKHFGFG